MRDDQEMNILRRVISHLVRCARRNPDALSGIQNNCSAIHFHDSLPREHVKELLRVMVKMSDLRRARRHPLLNHTQLRIPYQMPAITMAAPDVMFGG